MAVLQNKAAIILRHYQHNNLQSFLFYSNSFVLFRLLFTNVLLVQCIVPVKAS
ncbi:MAG: hypothetical protein GPOALKHO_001669 [Sodalis sp.]|nr:MAG: hypothetical protein GPOALKHO_001669 [Sodalis sp.]